MCFLQYIYSTFYTLLVARLLYCLHSIFLSTLEIFMKLKLIAAALITASFSLGAIAEGFNYTYVQADVGKLKIDSDVADDVDADVMALAGSAALTDNVFLVGGYNRSDWGYGIKYNTLSLGVGYHTPISATTDFVGTATYQRLDLDTPLGSAEEPAYGISAALRHSLNETFELDAGVTYVTVDSESETGVYIGGLAHVHSNIDLGLTIAKPKDATGYSVFARYNF